VSRWKRGNGRAKSGQPSLKVDWQRVRLETRFKDTQRLWLFALMLTKDY
jgi:hypothetical protein